MESVYYTGVKPLLFSFVVSVLLLAGCNNRPRLIGSQAPDFTVQDSDRTVSLHDFKGKPVLLNFWATYCGPCVEEMPSLVQLQRKMGDRITVVAVSEDSDEEAYHQFLKTYKIDLLTVRDKSLKSKDLYQTTGIPETFVIDASGRIRRKFVGSENWTKPDIIDYLNKL